MVNIVHHLEGHRHLFLGEMLGRVTQLWKGVINSELHPLDLTYSRWNALLGLKRLGDHVSQKCLANDLEIELGSLMRTLTQLEEQGLIHRYSNNNDRRARIVSLTPAGQDILKTIETKVSNVRKKMLSGFEEQEISQLKLSLEKIAGNALHTIEQLNITSEQEGKNT